MKKLKPWEIDRTLERIREEYDHYIVHFHQTPARKKAFEERWRLALSQGRDMTLFLGVEVQVVKELVLEAQRTLEAAPQAPLRVKKPQSYADRVIEELRKRIQGYPALGLPDHPEKSPDVDRLYGTLDWFSRQAWPHLWTLLKSKDPSPALVSLDQEIASLVSWNGQLPKELDAYVHLYQSAAPSSQIAKAQNRCLWLGSAFFHRCADLLAGSLERSPDAWSLERPKKEETELVRRTLGLVKKILDDFRLKDLKPRQE
ncbi:MAG: hypothetical protein HKM06_05320 [Spirochaetales bacterium]|nr:hypothetical protein [Spirochaetales bacterium]